MPKAMAAADPAVPAVTSAADVNCLASTLKPRFASPTPLEPLRVIIYYRPSDGPRGLPLYGENVSGGATNEHFRSVSGAEWPSSSLGVSAW